MKHFVYLKLFVCVFFFSFTQSVIASDLYDENLKGPVCRITEETVKFRYAFGEVVEDGTSLYRDVIYDNAGNSLFSCLLYEKARYKTLWYKYDEYGRLIKEKRMDFKESEYEKSKDSNGIPSSYDPLENYSEFRYEYNSDSKIKSVCDYRCFLNEKYDYEDESRPWSSRKTAYHAEFREDLNEKQIYNYDNDGYEIVYYYGSGAKNNREFCQVNIKERYKIYYDEGLRIIKYDENWRKIDSGRYIKASNGNIDVSTYYSYNNNGDLTSMTSRTTAAIAYDGLEDLQEYIHRNHEIRNGIFYEYEYDDYKNWISKKEYRIKNDESELISWVRRKIEYSTGKNIYEPMLDSIAIAREEERKVALVNQIKRQNAIIEFENRPEYPDSHEIEKSLKSVITSYPEEKSLLWKSFNKDWFKVYFKIGVGNEGHIKRITGFEYGFSNLRPNKKISAECESFVQQINIESAPDVSKSKCPEKYLVKVTFYKGSISVAVYREGYY